MAARVDSGHIMGERIFYRSYTTFMFLGLSPGLCGKTTPLSPNSPARPTALLRKVWSADLHHWFCLGLCSKCRISAHPTPLNQSLHFSQVPRAFVNPVEFEKHRSGLPCGVCHFPPGLFQLIAMKSPVPNTPKTANFISEALQSQYPQLPRRQLSLLLKTLWTKITDTIFRSLTMCLVLC